MLSEGYKNRLQVLSGIVSEGNIVSKRENIINILNHLEFKNDIVQNNGKIYAVGGIVRDAEMGVSSDDLDIVIQGVPKEVIMQILSKYGSVTDTAKQNDENKNFGVIKFVSYNDEFNAFLNANGVKKVIDVALPRKDSKDLGVKGHKGIKSDVDHSYSIHDDLGRRDITINSMAIDNDGQLIDPGGRGIADIQGRVIRHTSDEAFADDPLRMIRAIRMGAKFDYKLDPETERLIRAHRHLLGDKEEMPSERFLGEFEKMIGKSDLGRGVFMLVDLGIYPIMFGVESHIKDFKEFDKVKNIGDFCFALFKDIPGANVSKLTSDNITNNIDTLKYVTSLVNLRDTVIKTLLEKKIVAAKVVSGTPNIYESGFIPEGYIKMLDQFKNGKYPANVNQMDIDGMLVKNFVESKGLSKNNIGTFLVKAFHMILDDKLPNNEQAIMNFIQTLA